MCSAPCLVLGLILSLTSLVHSQFVIDAEKDICFVLDGSDSITDRRFIEIQDILKAFIDGSNIAPDRVNMGMVVFSNEVDSEVPLFPYRDASGLYAGVDSLTRERDITNAHVGIAMCRLMLEDGQSRRPNTKSVMVIITDGNSNSPASTREMIRLAEDIGITVFAIVIGHLLDFDDIAEYYDHLNQDYRLSTIYESFAELNNDAFGALEFICPPCDQPLDVGPCDNAIPRYYYNSNSDQCLPFDFGGCDGNANNFEDLLECEIVCTPVCQQLMDPGPCEEALPRFYYDFFNAQCVPFTYSGCYGNDNNFNTAEECRSACSCGNGDVDSDLGEQCDDGNRTPGDGCNEFCVVEACGDGKLDFGEECDDDNTTPGDGCNEFCVLEACGNGNLDFGEECDDGNTTPGDGCNGFCFEEACGNGNLDFGEECDDGNRRPRDGCDQNCVLEDPDTTTIPPPPSTTTIPPTPPTTTSIPTATLR